MLFFLTYPRNSLHSKEIIPLSFILPIFSPLCLLRLLLAFFFLFTEVKFIYHKVNHFKVYNSVAFMLCKHYFQFQSILLLGLIIIHNFKNLTCQLQSLFYGFLVFCHKAPGSSVFLQFNTFFSFQTKFQDYIIRASLMTQ